MGMQAKYGALEIKSKELLAQQGNAVSGASVALNSLGSRLEQLVEQLIASYNISEQELEVNMGMRFLWAIWESIQGTEDIYFVLMLPQLRITYYYILTVQ